MHGKQMFGIFLHFLNCVVMLGPEIWHYTIFGSVVTQDFETLYVYIYNISIFVISVLKQE